MDLRQSLLSTLKRLRLSGLLPMLPDRVSHARKTKMTELDFFELVLSDEVARRDQHGVDLRIQTAGFEESRTLEDFDWNAPVTFDRDRVRELFGLGFLDRYEDVAFIGPVGVGKTMLASALGHAACRAGRNVRFLRSDVMLRELRQSRADNSTERLLRSLLAHDLLILDDFGLRTLDREQSNDIYEVLRERHRRASTVITSNRAIDEWIALFDDPVLAQSAIDRFAHNAHQVILDGPSYRPQLGPDGPARRPLPDGPPSRSPRRIRPSRR
jgi:DNA replication protein DnaC